MFVWFKRDASQIPRIYCTVCFSSLLFHLSQDFEVPEHVGIPIGGGEDFLYRLEIHYNNPTLIEGIILLGLYRW